MVILCYLTVVSLGQPELHKDAVSKRSREEGKDRQYFHHFKKIVVFFELQSSFIDQTGFDLLILLPQPPES